ncbi:hypothetical protein FA15DRAFT_655763 [Coprinopsis marcescibilis]|uniref:Uncharacterized protein n=1 Tax=Coprinopsis marcescibilis TaxID=230819 RepID=A0A5C3KXU8_COPMA|nr:hypothetical protein FA15DRAFT_655763 [Coprinopsis marcescibilis]
MTAKPHSTFASVTAGTDVQLMVAVKTVEYASIASIAFLLYDILLTTADECHGVIGLSYLATQVIDRQDGVPIYSIRDVDIPAVRVVPSALSSITDSTLDRTSRFIRVEALQDSPDVCQIWSNMSVARYLMAKSIIVSVDYVLILRVFALYPRNKLVRRVSAALWIMEVLAFIIAIIVGSPKIERNEHCIVRQLPQTLLIGIVVPLFVQGVLFSFTASKFYTAIRDGWGNVPIIKVLARDGTWAFILLFCKSFVFCCVIHKRY